MNILVTGANGFIGSHLVAHLSELGHTVEEFDIRLEDTQTVADYETIKNAVQRNESVFHLAAVADVWDTDKTKLFDANILGVRNLARAIEETNTELIFTSSITAQNPTNLYATTKEIGEDILAQSTGDAKWVRLTNVVGNRTQKGQVAAMVKQAHDESRIEVWGNGDITRSYVSVKTVCQELTALLNSTQNGYIKTIASKSMTNRTVAEMIADAAETTIKIEEIAKMPPSPKSLVATTVDGKPIQPAIKRMVTQK